jgi:hypothetical protein
MARYEVTNCPLCGHKTVDRDTHIAFECDVTNQPEHVLFASDNDRYCQTGVADNRYYHVQVYDAPARLTVKVSELTTSELVDNLRHGLQAQVKWRDQIQAEINKIQQALDKLGG